MPGLAKASRCCGVCSKACVLAVGSEDTNCWAIVPLVLDRREALLGEYVECGGRLISFEDKRSALLHILSENTGGTCV